MIIVANEEKLIQYRLNQIGYNYKLANQLFFIIKTAKGIDV